MARSFATGGPGKIPCWQKGLKAAGIVHTVAPNEGKMAKPVKLKDLYEGIGTACNVRKASVSAVLAETFKQIRGALARGDRVTIPEFGTFVIRAAKEEGGPKNIRFRPADWAGPRKTGGKKRQTAGAEASKPAPAKAG